MTLEQILLRFTGCGIAIRRLGLANIQAVRSISIDSGFNKIAMKTADFVYFFDLKADFEDSGRTVRIPTADGELVALHFRTLTNMDNRRLDEEALLRQDLRLRAIRHTMGFVENGSSAAIKLSQDDATKDFSFSQDGAQSLYDSSFGACSIN